MKSGITFQELAKLQKEQLSKQPPLTLEQMQESIRKVQQGKCHTKKVQEK